MFVSTQLRPRVQALLGCPPPSTGPMGVEHPQGLRSPLCFSFSNDHAWTRTVCVQVRAVSRRRTTLQVWMLSGPWGVVSGTESGSLCWEGERALSPLAGASGSSPQQGLWYA